MDRCVDCQQPIWDGAHRQDHPFKVSGKPRTLVLNEPLQFSSTWRLVRDLSMLVALLGGLWLAGVIGGVP